MNKQEAIEKVTERMKQLNMGGAIWVKKDDVIEIISQVHEPQKMTVPKFVAEWIEECKRSGWHLQKALYSLDDDEKVGNWAYDENDDLINEKVDIFVSAWLDGYEVEKEKLYTVEIPNPVLTDNSDSVTVIMKLDSGVVLTDVVDYIGRKQELVYQLTEAEIKKDFDFLWQLAKEVENDTEM
jgi:predicted pyridoxine 5'-phosphate oxidase superfamily flavin-nucleotide-binding protein